MLCYIILYLLFQDSNTINGMSYKEKCWRYDGLVTQSALGFGSYLKAKKKTINITTNLLCTLRNVKWRWMIKNTEKFYNIL